MRAFLMIICAPRRSRWPRRPLTPQITSQDLLDGLKDPTRWLTYGGDYSGQRHSPLTQITPENVNQLAAQWTFQTGTLGSFETTPLVVDGVLYVDRLQQQRVGDRRAVRTPDLALSARVCRRTGTAAAAPSTAASPCSAIGCS